MTTTSRTIIISPTYNELDNAEILIPALFFHIPEISLLIVDDSSPDGTFSAVKVMQKRFPNLYLIQRPAKSGLGSAYREAFGTIARDKRFDTIISMDADFSHDFRMIPRMLEELQSFDLVVGSRYISGGSIQNWGPARRILSILANAYVRSILRLNIKDVTTGFTCFKKEILHKISLDTMQADGYAFLVEFKYRVFQRGCAIKELPILFKERRAGISKLSWRVIWESIKLPWILHAQ